MSGLHQNKLQGMSKVFFCEDQRTKQSHLFIKIWYILEIVKRDLLSKQFKPFLRYWKLIWRKDKYQNILSNRQTFYVDEYIESVDTQCPSIVIINAKSN